MARFRNPRELRAMFAGLKNKIRPGGKSGKRAMPKRNPISEYDEVSTPRPEFDRSRRPDPRQQDPRRPKQDRRPRPDPRQPRPEGDEFERPSRFERPNAVARPMRDREEEASGIFRSSEDYYQSKSGPKKVMFEAPKQNKVDDQGKPKKTTRDVLREMIAEAKKKLDRTKSLFKDPRSMTGRGTPSSGRGTSEGGPRRSQYRDEQRY